MCIFCAINGHSLLILSLHSVTMLPNRCYRQCKIKQVAHRQDWRRGAMTKRRDRSWGKHRLQKPSTNLGFTPCRFSAASVKGVKIHYNIFVCFLKFWMVCLSLPTYKCERMSWSVVSCKGQGNWQYLHLVVYLEMKGSLFPHCLSGEKTRGLKNCMLHEGKKVLLIREIGIMETHKNKRQECLQMLGSRTSTCKINVWQFPPTPFCYFHPIWIPALPIHSHICSQTWYQHQFNHILSIYRAVSAGLHASQEKLTLCLC